jgi:hypothetical protein
MAILTGTGDSYTLSSSVGKGRHLREDLMDMIINVSPTETPFLSSMKTGKATGVYHEWLTHTLATPSASAVAVEGNVVTFTAPSVLTRNFNVTQINQKTIAVTGTQETVMKAGMKSEMAYRVINAVKELKRDLETAMFQNTTATTGSTSAARQLQGVAGLASTSTTSATVSKDLINTMLQTIWGYGTNPDVMYVNGAFKAKISSFAINTGSNMMWNADADAKKWSAVVSVWDGDFGVQRIVAARHMGTQSVACLESQHWRHAVLRPLKTVDLAVDGDNVKKMILMESTLEALATTAGGAYYTYTGAV